MNEDQSYNTALTIAGSDSGGGAGIQADLKTFSALGCYGMTVLTALTAQNTVGVQGIYGVPASFVGEQLDSVTADITVDAVKIGMLHDPAIIETVAEKIDEGSLPHVVLDPVMVAQSGDKLIKDEAIEALTKHLFPRAEIITPNLPEAEELLNKKIETSNQVEEGARQLLEFGSDAVLLKGGHSLHEKSTDCLAYGTGTGIDVEWLKAEYVDTNNTHGTGCTLSSAIAASLAQDKSLVEAVTIAKQYTTGAIKAGSGYHIGKGNGPLHHFYQLWNDNIIKNLKAYT